MKRTALVAAGVGVLLAPLLFFMGGSDEPAAADPYSATLNPAGIPAEMVPWIEKAGELCGDVTAPLIAAQLKAESGFDPEASSGVAFGVSQFTEATWSTWGVDANGNGSTSYWEPADAIMAQGRYMCFLVSAVAPMSGDKVDLALAAYNAGLGNVQKYGGIPPFAETRDYIARIHDYVTQFTAVTSAGAVVFPLASGVRYVDNDNFGRSGSMWSSTHTGNDYSAACGSTVVAATDGVVIAGGSNTGWGGPNFLIVQTNGPKTLATWYAHMQSKRVVTGQRVAAGQALGAVGQLGNSTGCHLHFEVHPHGGTIYQDPVDPVPWLKAHIGAPVASSSGLIVATFNTLGDSHTRPGGDKCCKWDQSGVRMARFAQRVTSTYRPDVLGFQEFQPVQARRFDDLLGSQYERYSIDDNAVVWRRDRLDLLDRQRITIPYFGGRPRDMPIALLADRTTGRRYAVISVHNPADTEGPAGRFRAEAIKREREEVAQLTGRGFTVVMVGDFNDRGPAYCGVTAGGLMTASDAGAVAGNGACRPPARMGIDWLFVSGGSRWRGNQTDFSTIPGVSDHPYVTATLQ